MKKLREKPKQTDCERCSLSERQYCPPWLPLIPQWPVLLVGQAPGETETTIGIPFRGPAGKTLFSLMQAAGLRRDGLWQTNVCGCFPPEDRKPTDLEMACCRPRLYDEIQQLKPKLIVALGDCAVNLLCKRDKKISVLKRRGEFFPLNPEWDYECTVLCCLHPSFVMRQRQWIEDAVKDLQLIIDFCSSDYKVPQIKLEYQQPNFNMNPTSQEVQEYLSRDEITAFDLEALSLNKRKDDVTASSFCNTSHDAILIHQYEYEKWDIVRRWWEDPKAKKCTQNGSFDFGKLTAYGIDGKGLAYDTRLAAHLLNSDLPTDLQFLRKEHTDIPAYKRDRKAKDFQQGAKVSDIECCWDSFVTREVMLEQKKLLTPEHLAVLYEIYVPLVFTLNKMERRGIKASIPMIASLHKQVTPYLNELYEEHFKPIGINPNSPVQLKKLFNLKTTDEDELKLQIRRRHPQAKLMEAVLDYRGLAKADSSFLVGAYRRLEQGRIHTSFQPDGTGTGRISSQNPNLQQVPEFFRVIYESDDEAHLLANADYNQLELVVAAILGRETALLSEISQGIKPHHVLGKVIFGRDWDQLTDQEKLREKAVLFGTMGGRSARSIAIEFNVSVAQAEQWQALCVRKYPGLKRYQDICLDEYRRTGEITTAFGTQRKVNTPNQAMNNKFQGSASFVTLSTLNELDRVGFDLRLTVHDSIIWQFHKSELRESIQEARRIIERPIRELNNHQFTCKIKYGLNWGEMEELKVA